jgi:UDP-3-O-[3-hydroxymyristoyl] N-acetylglucosamine deacetylase
MERTYSELTPMPIIQPLKPAMAEHLLKSKARGLQKTLARPIVCTGIGVHTGAPVTMVVKPASANHGVLFVRTDVDDGMSPAIPALWNAVIDTSMCTIIGGDGGLTVSTIEHLMAALRGCGIDNALVELNGPEVPIMDGSARGFVDAIREVGVTVQDAPLRYTVILKSIEVRQGNAYARLHPSKRPFFRMTFDAHGRLPNQSHSFVYYPTTDNFVDCLASARTFGFFEDAEQLWALGLAKGASPENTIIIEKDGGIMNTEGLRYENEFVRHKVLDAVGDLALASGHIDGSYEGYNAGHKLNNLLLRALYADAQSWCYQTADNYQLSEAS